MTNYRYGPLRSLGLAAPGLAALGLVLLLSTAGASEPKVDTAKASVGRSTFRSYCASCHGKQAQGDGPVAEYLEPRPADLTKIRARRDGEFPFDEIARYIDGRGEVRGHGNREMPVWGEAFKIAGSGTTDEETVARRIEQIVHFLASIQE